MQDFPNLLVKPMMYWINMMQATNPPTAIPTVELSLSGQMTHTAYTKPPQMIIATNVPNALSNSRICIPPDVILNL